MSCMVVVVLCGRKRFNFIKYDALNRVASFVVKRTLLKIYWYVKAV